MRTSEFSIKRRVRTSVANLFLFDRLKDFDNAFFTVDDIYAFKDLTVLPPSHFSDNLIVILVTAKPYEEIRVFLSQQSS